ncbi:MAG: glutamate--tRNA ligase [Candidatus Pacearchaeota archaeon]
MDQLLEIIRKHALKNAFDYGKANTANVVGKVVAEFPEAKKDMKKTMKLISDVINEVNSLSKEAIEEQMKKYEYKQKKEQKKEIDVEGAERGKVVTRFPPEPNGWPHIGHAKAFCLSWTIARKYKGKVILRWDDTNPEAEKQEYVDAIKDGIKWLGLDWDEEVYCSDYMLKMYSLGEQLIRQNDAYFCNCSQEKISLSRQNARRCECGSRHTEENIALWNKMLNGDFEEGQGVIRLKGDMSSLNTVMRDPTLFRVIKTPHFRQGKKYNVWPTYDFQGPVMDSLLGITHPIRSKEYELRDELYVFLLKKLNMYVPKMISISRLSIKNAPVSKRLLRPLVESGKLWGWDDPRLPTLAGLRRRGILPEAVRKFVLSSGISKSESEGGWEILLAENRKLLDPISKHYFFVSNPVKIEVEGLPQDIELKFHPKEDLGKRKISLSKNIYISKEDAVFLKKGEIIRLKDLSNIQIISENPLKAKAVGGEMPQKKIQWVSEVAKLECEIAIPHDLLDESGNFNEGSLEIVKGYCESTCSSLAPFEIIQFERFGFCKLDKNEKDKLFFILSC